MKKTIALLFIFIFTVGFGAGKKQRSNKVKKTVKTVIEIKEEKIPVSYVSRALADENGNIIFEENGKLVHPIASVTKMMTILLIMEKIEKKELSYEDIVDVTPATLKVGEVSAGLKYGESYTLEDLMKAAVVHSCNDAAYLVSEYAGKGDVEKFVEEMNEKAVSLRLVNTKYYTPTGLPTRNTGKPLDISTAEDMVKLGVELSKHPKYFELSKQNSITIKEIHTGKESIFRNTNKLIGIYDGMDGMKTGFHRAGMFNIVATAKRDDMRFITVVFGSDNNKLREKEVITLLDYAFETYQTVKVSDTIKPIAKAEVGKYSQSVIVYAKEEKFIIEKKNETGKLARKLYLDKLEEREIQENDKIGYISIIRNGKEIAKVDAVARRVEKRTSFVAKAVKIMTFGLF
jgi:serine-type D-Ala-D-Ala carboxypeptidase (penicillin-binding protein 5/6)